MSCGGRGYNWLHAITALKSITMAEAMDTGVQAAAATGAARIPEIPPQDRPTCVICLGMAGSGKTTFVQVR